MEYMEQGYIKTTDDHAKAGVIKVKMDAAPVFARAEHVWHTKHVQGKLVAGSEELYVEVEDNDLVIHLNPKKRLEGLHIVWSSFDS